MNPFLDYVERIKENLEQVRSLSVSGRTVPVERASKVLLFSPHPDDECITGLLPLRLMRELDKQIINVPVTFGSNPDRQTGRARELEAACGYLGWDVQGASADYSALGVDALVKILHDLQPEIIFMPHAEDWNSRHIATHHLVVDALEQMPDSFSCTVVETEFWGAMDDPNLLVEGDADLVADLVAATSLHTGEVARNPYHLLLPAWMQDNVRRGGELVGGQGGSVPDFSFATLYRMSNWQDSTLVPYPDGGISVPVGRDNLKALFE